jgi:proline iminopeptidase
LVLAGRSEIVLPILRRLLKAAFYLLGALVAVLALCALAVFLATRGDYAVARTVAQDPTLPHVVLGGYAFHAEAFGAPKDPVVLVLHGGPGNDYRYLLALRALADQYRVVFYDQRGTGLSPRVDPQELTLERMLADLDLMVDQFGQGQPVSVVGHSWGAMLASGYLGRHPEKVQAAVLAEPGMLTTEKAREFEGLMRRGGSLALVVAAARSWFRSRHVSGPDDQARDDFFFQDLMSTVPPEKSPLAGYFCDPADARRITYWRYSWRSSLGIPNHARNAQGEVQIDLVSGVERSPRPVLFLCGACDRLIGTEYQRDHMRHFPTARLEVIQGAGHSMFTDRPEESVAAVRGFLDEAHVSRAPEPPAGFHRRP